MAINVSRPNAPTMTVNGTDIGKLEVKHSSSDKSFTGNRDAVRVSNPATIRFSGPTGATIRYTFNSKLVNLGSSEYDSNNPPVIRYNGNGFDSDTTTIRAKSYLNGEVSEQVEFVVTVDETA